MVLLQQCRLPRAGTLYSTRWQPHAHDASRGFRHNSQSYTDSGFNYEFPDARFESGASANSESGFRCEFSSDSFISSFDFDARFESGASANSGSGFHCEFRSDSFISGFDSDAR